MKRKGHKTALLVSIAAVGVIVVAVYNLREDLIHAWYRHIEWRIPLLTRRAADAIQSKDYTIAEETCRRILHLRPDHRVARFWLRNYIMEADPAGETGCAEEWQRVRPRFLTLVPIGPSPQHSQADGKEPGP